MRRPGRGRRRKHFGPGVRGPVVLDSVLNVTCPPGYFFSNLSQQCEPVPTLNGFAGYRQRPGYLSGISSMWRR